MVRNAATFEYIELNKVIKNKFKDDNIGIMKLSNTKNMRILRTLTTWDVFK